jgi:threonyl-tRNA synthetase
VNGAHWDLAWPIEADAEIAIHTMKDEAQALELIRHDLAHVMARAVQEIWPEVRVTIGPVIENGWYYDFDREEPFTPEDLGQIEAKMREIINRRDPVTTEIWDRDRAVKYYEANNEPYKVELVGMIPEGQPIRMYWHGHWQDLCRGPHLQHTGQLPADAFKLMSVAGAYWRGDSNRPMLQRIYGVAFRNRDDLKAYLTFLEEAEKRDHRRLGREMELFHFQEEAPGMVFWHPNGWTIYRDARGLHAPPPDARGLQGDQDPPGRRPQAVGGLRPLGQVPREHVHHRDRRGTCQREAGECAQADELPLPRADLQPGPEILPRPAAEAGRVRLLPPLRGPWRAARADARARLHAGRRAYLLHRGPDRGRMRRLHRASCRASTRRGLRQFRHQALDPPDVRVGSDEIWDKAESALEKAILSVRNDYEIDPGEGAFYGPKLDFKLTDAIGREWQCGTFQADFNLPERLDANYIGPDGEKHRPVMLHRAILGSFERFIGIMIENYAGKLPFWLAPRQVVVASIVSEADDFVQEAVATLTAAGLRAEADIRNEKINYKVREHSVGKVPVILAVGRKEVEDGTVTVRRLGEKQTQVMPLDALVAELAAEAVPPDLR